MDIKEDEYFIRWFNSLSKTTGKTYIASLRRYCNYLDKTPTELIEEAREDYINPVMPWEYRHINYYEGFINELKKMNLADGTKLVNLNIVKGFYDFYSIPLKKIKHHIPNVPREEYLDLPVLKIEDIRKAVNITGDDKLMKALILTIISSVQGVSEVLNLKGRHLKNIKKGVAVVQMVRGKAKTGRKYTFFISHEALDAIYEYKPSIEDGEYIFTKKDGGKLSGPHVSVMFTRYGVKLGFAQGYFMPHRGRHLWKTVATGRIDQVHVEYIIGHKLDGSQDNYYVGERAQEELLEAYIQVLPRFTVFTNQETLQKENDTLKAKQDGVVEQILEDNKMLKKQMTKMNEFIELFGAEGLKVLEEEVG